MAEAIGLTASLITLVATAYSSCKTLHDLSSGICNAPRHIRALSQDLDDYYLVLGTLQSLLSDQDYHFTASHASTSKDLAMVLENSLAVFKDLNTILGTYKKRGSLASVGKRACWRWHFEEKEIEARRRSLNAHKLTMNTAISVANLYDLNSSSAHSNRIVSDVAEDVHHVQEKLMIMQMEMEEVRAAQLPMAPKLVDIESAALKTDYKFALRHYLDDVRSDGTITPSPSMQVSSLGNSNSLMVSTMFHTALTHFDEPTDSAIRFGHQIARAFEKFESKRSLASLSVYGSPGPAPLHFEIPWDCSIRGLKSLVAGRLELLHQHPQEFRLRYEGRILHDDDCLRSCGICYRAVLGYEAVGLQFQRFIDLPDVHYSPKTGRSPLFFSNSGDDYQPDQRVANGFGSLALTSL